MSYEKLNAMQIITAGSDDDCVALAPAGTKAPTTLAIPTSFKEVGWIDKDGIEFTADDSVDKRRAHQGNRVYKVQMTESDSGLTFTALQSNIDTLKLQWTVKASSEDSGVIKHVLSSSRKVENVAIIVYAEANGHKYLWHCENFQIGEREGFKLANTDDVAYKVTGTFTGDITMLTDDEAFKAA